MNHTSSIPRALVALSLILLTACGDSSDSTENDALTGALDDVINAGDGIPTFDSGNAVDTGETVDTGDMADTADTGATVDTGDMADTADTGETADTGTPDAENADTENADIGDDTADADSSGYASPCTDDVECDSSLCIVIVAGADEGVCTQPCATVEDCDDASDCVLVTNSGVDAVRVCVPRDYCLDRDEDGYGLGPGCIGPDCDDTEAASNPGADEVCDGIDNDCDDNVDDNPVDEGGECDTGALGVCAEGTFSCIGGLLECTANTSAGDEICNNLDDNCDGEVDNNPTTATLWYRDADGDRFGDDNNTIRACARPEGYVDAGGDCNDARANANPVGTEVCDGIDNDCDDTVDEGFESSSLTSCDGNPDNGCETDLSTSDAHCGACGNACDAGVACVDGACGCPAGTVDCGGTCETPNACGGCGTLTGAAGDACGACGVLACNGSGGLSCVDPGRNGCGGCGELAGEPNAPCGSCGVYVCNGVAAVTCSDPGTNACGGCSTLPATPGESCSACGSFSCNGTDALSCTGPGANACGGCDPLPDPTSGSCGYCSTGAWQCTTAESSSCVGATNALTDNNNCGACGVVCDSGRVCTGGSCACPADQIGFNSQPTGRTLCAGASASLAAGVSGTGLSYQWESFQGGGWVAVENNATFSGATTPALEIANASAALNGLRLRLRVDASCSTRTSNEATITVNTPPTGASATASPTTLCQGGTLNLSASASGATSIAWTGPNGFTASGSNASVASVTTSAAGVYTATASNSCGTAAANTASVTVNTAPAISSQPSARSTCAGSATTFSVGGSGTGLSWQWQVSTNGGSTWSNVSNGGSYSGATSTTLSVTPTGGMNGYLYRAVASGTCGSATSGSAALTVNTAPTGVSASASPNPICVGATLGLSASASGATSWSWSGPGGFSSSSQNPSRTSMQAAQAGVYTVTASNSCGSTQASTASVTVNTAPAISSQPSARSTCAGSATTFSVGGSGTGLSWQWQVSTNGGSTWSNVSNGGSYSGATSTTLSVTPTGGMNGYLYRAVASGTCGSATSGSAALTVNTAPTGVSASASPNPICVGATLGLSASASGATSWSWSGPGGFSSSSQNPSRTSMQAAQAGVYTVTASNSCGSTQASTASVTVANPPRITSNPTGTIVLENTPAEFTVGATADGSLFAIRWQESIDGTLYIDLADGLRYSGVSTSTLTVVPRLLMAGNRYRAVASNLCGTATSTSAPLGVGSAPTGCCLLCDPPGPETIGYYDASQTRLIDGVCVADPGAICGGPNLCLAIE